MVDSTVTSAVAESWRACPLELIDCIVSPFVGKRRFIAWEQETGFIIARQNNVIIHQPDCYFPDLEAIDLLTGKTIPVPTIIFDMCLIFDGVDDTPLRHHPSPEDVLGYSIGPMLEFQLRPHNGETYNFVIQDNALYCCCYNDAYEVIGVERFDNIDPVAEQGYYPCSSGVVGGFRHKVTKKKVQIWMLVDEKKETPMSAYADSVTKDP